MKKSAKMAAADHVRRSNSTRAAFLFGVPLALLVLGIVRFGLHGSVIAHYVKNPVECVEVLLFCCGAGALGTKLWQNVRERAACNALLLPSWDHRPVPVSDAPDLLAYLKRAPERLHNTYLYQRVANALDFLCRRHSAAEFDDQLRTLVDADALALESSYALTRFITWAIPILGFLGTVLGITDAIAGATPERLESSLSSVTDGLAFAFDATALALALTMLAMFLSFLVERQEQAILEAVDLYVDRHLAHRFLRTGADSGPFFEAVRQQTQVLVDTTGQLVRRQAETWAQTLAEVDRRASSVQSLQQDHLIAALEAALDRTLQVHAERLAALESQAVAQGARLMEPLAALATTLRETTQEQQATLARVATEVAGQATALARLHEGESELVRLQTTMQQNLAALAGAGNFDQAVHSLTAAIHLLTARAGSLANVGEEGARGPRLQPGRAA